MDVAAGPPSPGDPRHGGDPVPGRHRRSALVLAFVLVAGLGAGGAAVVQRIATASQPPPTTGSHPDGPDARATPNASQGTRSDAAGRVPSAQPADLAALSALLVRRARAVLAHDRKAWLREVDPGSEAFLARQDATYDALRQLPVQQWAYSLDGVGPALTPARARALPAGAWVARVTLRYRLRGIDATDVERVQYLTVARHGGRELLAEDRDGDSSANPAALRDLWDVQPVRVVASSAAIVVGSTTTSVDRLAAYATAADRAVAAVDEVWTGPWPRRVLLFVPARESEMAALVDTPQKGLDQIAAVTTGEVVAGGRVTGDRVVLNPATFPALPPVGRAVVLAHEVTHVATRAMVAAKTPIWLTEGFADYIGYRHSGVPLAVAAADLLALARAGEAPSHLPTDPDFDPARGNVSPAYNGAWLACRMLAQRYGEAALVRIYVASATGGTAGLATALAGLHTDLAHVTADWRDYVAARAA